MQKRANGTYYVPRKCATVYFANGTIDVKLFLHSNYATPELALEAAKAWVATKFKRDVIAWDINTDDVLLELEGS